MTEGKGDVRSISGLQRLRGQHNSLRKVVKSRKILYLRFRYFSFGAWGYDTGKGTREGRKRPRDVLTDHLLAVILASEGLEGGLNNTATETEDEVEG